MRGALTTFCVLAAAAAGSGCGITLDLDSEPDQPKTPSGAFPPAEPLGDELSPEMKEFAEQVDRACATNFNASMIALSSHQVRSADWSERAGESAYRFIQANYQQQTHDEIAALGSPPEQEEVFADWLENVGRRAELMRMAGRGWQKGDRTQSTVASLKILAAKIDADWLARHLGLRICASNGPANNLGGEDDYLDRVNEKCRARIGQDYELYRRQAFSIRASAGTTAGETLAMASEAPPDEQYELRKRLLAARTELDDQLQRIVKRYEAGGLTVKHSYAVFDRAMIRGRNRIAEEFDVPDCRYPNLKGLLRLGPRYSREYQ